MKKILIFSFSAIVAVVLAVIIVFVMKRTPEARRIDLIDTLEQAREISPPMPDPSGGPSEKVVFSEEFESDPEAGWEVISISGDASYRISDDYSFEGRKSFLIEDLADGSEAVLSLTAEVKPQRYYRLTGFVKTRDLNKVEQGGHFQPFMATAAIQESRQSSAPNPWAREIESFSGFLHLPDGAPAGSGSTKGWHPLTIVFRTDPSTRFVKIYLVFSAYTSAVGKVYFDSIRLAEITGVEGLRNVDRLKSISGPMADYAKTRQSQGVVKRCLFTPAGTQLAYDLRLPERAILAFEPDLLMVPDAFDPSRVRYRVSLQAGGVEKTIFDRDLASIRGTKQKIDLSEFGGKHTTLTLGVESADPAPCVWMDPVVYSAERPEDQYNLLMITSDATRADRLRPYGFTDRPSSPDIDRLAASGVVFDDVYIQRASTNSSLNSVMTSTYPAWNGVHGAFEKLPPEMRTITHVLKDQGYESAAFHYIGRTAVEGFDEFYSQSLLSFAWNFITTPEHKDVDVYNIDQTLVDHAIEWMDDHSDRPFFAWVFLSGARHTFYPPEREEDRFILPDYKGPLSLDPALLNMQGDKICAERIVLKPGNREFLYAVYDSRVKAMDRQLGRLIEYLDRQGLRRKTLVVFFADHGSNLFDKKLPPLYPTSVHDPSTHIPLIMSLPGVVPEKKHVEGLAEGIDIVPTILDIMDMKGLENQAQGISLWPAARGERWTPRPFVISEIGKPLLCLRTREWKYIVNLDYNPEMYEWAHDFKPDNLGPDTNWETDPEDNGKFMLSLVFPWCWYAPRTLYHLTGEGGETVNVIDKYPEKAKELEAMLVEWDKKYRREIKAKELDPNAIKLLRETGYLPAK